MHPNPLRQSLTTLPLLLVAGLARADFYTYATGGVLTNMRQSSAKVGLDGGAKTSSALDIATSETADDAYGYDYASSHLQVLAEMGRLHAEADTYATHAYMGVGNENLGGGVAALFENARSFKSNGGIIGGNPFIGGRWEDLLHVNSAGLAYGSPVQFMLHMTLESSVSKHVPFETNANYVALTTSFGGTGLYLRNDVGSRTLVVDQLVTAHVGDDVFMQSTLDLHAETSGTKDKSASFVDIDALNTGIFSLDLLTPGATFTTDSGYRYAPQAVPEPSALAALSLGAVAVLRHRKRA